MGERVSAKGDGGEVLSRAELVKRRNNWHSPISDQSEPTPRGVNPSSAELCGGAGRDLRRPRLGKALEGRGPDQWL